MNTPLQAQEPHTGYLSTLQPPLLRHFNLLATATAPAGVARLRELILTLAVQGKLVPQDPSDEPASLLLQKIRAEKDRLIEAGKVRREKVIEQPLFDQELPVGWVYAQTQEICVVITDGDHLPPPKADVGIPFLVIGDVRNGIVELDAATRFVPQGYFDQLDWSKRPTAGDVLYTTVGSFGIPVPVVEDRDFCFQRHIALFRPGIVGLQGFLTLALRSKLVFDQAEAGATGIAQKTVPLSVLRRLQLPLPPLAEQSRIVSRVEELMRLCDALESQRQLETAQHAQLLNTLLGTLTDSASPDELSANWQRVSDHFDLLLDRPEAVDALEQTILQLAVRGLLVPQDPNDEPASVLLEKIRAEKERLVGEGSIKRDKPLPDVGNDELPFESPAGWKWVRFGELVQISSGVTLGRKASMAAPVSLPYMRVANVQRWRLSLDSMKEVVVDESELPRFQLMAGDLLITEGGDWDKVGRTAIWRDELKVCLHQNHVFKARGIALDWNPIWAELYLNSTDARAYFAASAKQTTNLASINMTELRGCLFPLPPLAEQTRIVARVNQLRSLCAELRERLSARQITQSRLAEALVEV